MSLCLGDKAPCGEVQLSLFAAMFGGQWVTRGVGRVPRSKAPSNPTLFKPKQRHHWKCISAVLGSIPSLPISFSGFPKMSIISIKKMIETQNLPSKSTLCRDKEPCCKFLKYTKYYSRGMFKGAERWKRISFAGNALGLGIKGPVYTHKVGELGKDSHLQTHRTWNYTVHLKNCKLLNNAKMIDKRDTEGLRGWRITELKKASCNLQRCLDSIFCGVPHTFVTWTTRNRICIMSQ